MLHRRFRHRRSFHPLAAPAILLIATLAAATTPAPADPSDESLPPATPDPGRDGLDRLQTELDEIKLRAQGMEGKLKESANARKAADQARMEAERRLAEGTQEMERLRAEVEELRTTSGDLERRLAARDTEVTRLTRELGSAMKAYDEMTGRLTELQGRLPASDGGVLTPEEARTAAADAFRVLREASQSRGDATDPAAMQALAAAEATLHRRQFRLAAVLDAQSVYRVRPNDSLALISRRFYGDGGQWEALFEANRHLLEDPDRLTPGITLVIP